MHFWPRGTSTATMGLRATAQRVARVRSIPGEAVASLWRTWRTSTATWRQQGAPRYSDAIVVVVYSPNSGQALERLQSAVPGSVANIFVEAVDSSADNL